MNRFGSMIYWFLSKDIEFARLMKHYFYTSGTTRESKKSNKVGNLSTSQNNIYAKSQEWLNQTRHDGDNSLLTRLIL